MAWWVWALLLWPVLAVVVGLVLARAIPMGNGPDALEDGRPGADIEQVRPRRSALRDLVAIGPGPEPS